MSEPVTSERTGRSSRLLAVLAAVLVLLVLALVAFLLLREQGDDEGELDLSQGLAAVELDAQVEGHDLVVVDTVQGVGVFVETDDGPVYVRYGDDIEDVFGIGTVVDVEGEVALVGDLDVEEREQVEGDFYVEAEELEVDED